jgi:biotin carboxyl carrier protein
MAYEVKSGDRVAKVELLNKVDNKIIITVDDKKYEVDILMVENGAYSLIWEGKSFNVELFQGHTSKHYIVNTHTRSFDLEIIDAESKYQKSSKNKDHADKENIISTPMSGKVIKILVAEGEAVEGGQTLIVVEAMKMQSEYKVKQNRVVKEIYVKEGDTINAHQPLILVE